MTTNNAKVAPNEGKPTILLKDRDPSELVLTFAGNVVKHLGVQMYAGRPVPAIAELISNAWDADAKEVKVRVPLGTPWDPTDEKQTIEVWDDGNGMTWDMVRDAYLDVGRDRREAEKTDRSPGGRLLQGRKGIGKLAGFGISDVVEVQTVYKDKDKELGERVLIWFSLSLDELKKAERRPAPVNLRYAGPVSSAPPEGRREQGTTVTLRRLHEKDAMNEERFHWSMARRFLLIGPKFHLTINRKELKPEKIKLQWRWPKNGWTIDNVEGCGPVKYWIGFTPDPRKQAEGELSGILVYTRGKISQESTFFEISGGVTGQHGLRYMVGMVRAEWLDEGVEQPDMIATHRGAIAWESPKGQSFQKWGQALVKKYLVEWARLRAELRKKAVTKLAPEFRRRIEQLAEPYQDVAYRFVEKFQNVEMEVTEFEELLSWFLDALENATLRRIIERLRQTDTADLESLDQLFAKMEIRTAVALLQIIEGNLAAIETLEKLHFKDAKERGVISKHLEKNPWLIHPSWVLNKAEGRVSKWIRNQFGLDKKGAKGDADRVDFFCLGVGGVLHIVEIKRGRHIAVLKDFEQANKYRRYVEKRFKELKDPESVKYGIIQSHLIAAELDPDAEDISTAFRDKGWVIFTTWDDLVERAKLSHHQFRKELQKESKEREPPAG